MDTRIAPSPTGNAHIGFVRTAYLNYLAARSSGGRFIVRIDDTDPVRSKPEFEANLLQTLTWLGLEWDELHHQSRRFDRYQAIAHQLVLANKAVVKDGATFLNPPKYIKSWTDEIAGDIKSQDESVIRNLVLLRSDGSPTYHFASCVDDIDFKVDTIIRGTDHISNTSKHIHIYQVLASALPKFFHVGLIFHNGKKISKRDGLASMEWYMDRYNPAAVLNAVLKLGWGHPNPKLDKEYPTISKDVAIRLFPEGKLKSVKSTLDVDKLNWLNKRF